jgi:outer membrane lipoprotein-sorting protein
MISERDEQQARLLEEYCQALMTDPSSPSPAGLEAELARASHQLRQQLRAPLPSARFAAALQTQLEAESAAPTVSEAETLPPAKIVPRPVRVARSTLGWLAAAALIVLAVAGALYVASDLASRAERQSLPVQPEAHTAAEIIARAKAMYKSDAIKSFELTEVFTPSGDTKPWKTTHIFYQAPDRSREENSDSTIKIDDGTTVWNYAPPRSADYGGDVSFYSHDLALRQMDGTIPTYVETLNYTIYKLTDCYQPTLVGEDVVAGRPTYVLDMGVEIPRCNSVNGNPYDNSRLWIDHDSYFILKDVPDKNRTLPGASIEITNIRYNPPLATDLFTFVMPKGVNFNGGWVTIPKGTNFNGGSVTSGVTDDEFRAQTAKIIGATGFTTYLPGYLPSYLPGLLQEKLQAEGLSYYVWAGQLGITYSQPRYQPHPPVPGTYIAYPTTLRLYMQQATPTHIASETKDLRKIVLGGGDAWTECGQMLTGSLCDPNSTMIVVIRGDTIISVVGSGIPMDELAKVVASLTPLPAAPPSGPAFPTMPPAPTQPPLPTEPDGTMP